MQQQQNNKPLQQEPVNFFDLIKIVGSKGKYQTTSLILWCFIWYLSGTILLGGSFLLYDTPYTNCPKNVEDCNQYVCKLPYDQRSAYLDKNALRTLANQFGDYHCQRSVQIQLANSMIYIGSFFGYLIVSFFIDNTGRKFSMLGSLIISVIGVFIVNISQSLFMAEIGLFISGFGIDSAINISFYFITQTVQNQLRQKYSVLIQAFFSIGSVVNILYYVGVGQWRTIYWIFFTFPLLASIILIFLLVQQTPQFLLIHNSPQFCVKSFLKIAEKNSKNIQNVSQVINEELIIKMQSAYKQKQRISDKKIFTPLDLFKYKSIRMITIMVFTLSFTIYLMYYGPLMFLEYYHLNVYISAIVITSSDMLVYPLFYCYVEKMHRKKWAFIFFGVATACSIALAFMHGNENQFFRKLQLLFIFIFRFSVSFQFALFLIYCNQLYPAQIRGLGIGISSAVGTLSSAGTPFIFGELKKTKFPIMIIFLAFGVISLICSKFLPQTLGKQPQQQIKEFGIPNQKRDEKQFNKNKQIQLNQQIQSS